MFYAYKTSKQTQVITKTLENEINKITKTSTLQELIEVYLEYFVKVNNAESTYKTYYHSYNINIFQTIGYIKLKDLTAAHIQGLFYYLVTNKKLSTNTIIKLHTLISRPLDILVKYKVLKYNIMNDVEKPKLIQNRTQVLTFEQTEQLLEYSKDRVIYIPLILTLIFALHKSEPLIIKWSDIDFKLRIISIKTLKINKIKTLKMPDSVCNLLQTWKIKQEESRQNFGQTAIYNDYVCTTPQGDTISEQMFAYHFKSICKNLNLENITLRSLRTSMATFMLISEVPIFLVSKWLAHSNTRTTEQYYINIPKPDLKRVSDQVDELFSNLL